MPSRSNKTQKRSYAATSPCNITPLTRNMVTESLLSRTAVKNTSCNTPARDLARSIRSANGSMSKPYAGITVEIACLYTNWDWPSRRNNTEKLSNQVTMPCNLTPFTRNIVTGVFDFLREFKKRSCKLFDLSVIFDFRLLATRKLLA